MYSQPDTPVQIGPENRAQSAIHAHSVGRIVFRVSIGTKIIIGIAAEIRFGVYAYSGCSLQSELRSKRRNTISHGNYLQVPVQFL